MKLENAPRQLTRYDLVWPVLLAALATLWFVLLTSPSWS